MFKQPVEKEKIQLFNRVNTNTVNTIVTKTNAKGLASVTQHIQAISEIDFDTCPVCNPFVNIPTGNVSTYSMLTLDKLRNIIITIFGESLRDVDFNDILEQDRIGIWVIK